MSHIHVVDMGDTLWSLAYKYETSVDALRLANGLTSDEIFIGQELVIPTMDQQHIEDMVTTAILPSIEGGFALPEGNYSQANLEDIALLARLVFAEARGEPFIGQIAVAAVLLNRVRHPEFPDSIKSAIYQPRQFEVVANGTINQTPNDLAYLAVLEALDGEDPTDGAVFFWNPRKVAASSWVWTQNVKLQIGEHVFA